MDYKVILNLMKEMNNTDLTKLEIEEEGIRITMEKASKVVTLTQPSVPQMNMSCNGVVGAPPVNIIQENTVSNQQQVQTNPSTEGTQKHTEEISGKKLVSPMVGTFYAAPAPDKPPFVKVGDKVKKGQTICIIEAMKLMNEIESEHDGEIVKVLVDNETMVEFGQPLFLIK